MQRTFSETTAAFQVHYPMQTSHFRGRSEATTANTHLPVKRNLNAP
jgi:hypothetical protein